jgi:hypothetical protein
MSMALLFSMTMRRLMTFCKSSIDKMCVDVDDPHLSSSLHMWKEQYCEKLLPVSKGTICGAKLSYGMLQFILKLS